jgi:hypothetical protein
VFVDTFDLLLDLVASPDLGRWRWKDEDEYVHGLRLGVVSDAEHVQVERAREEVVALLERRSGPFAIGAATWTASPTWPVPTLPGGAARAAAGG